MASGSGRCWLLSGEVLHPQESGSSALTLNLPPPGVQESLGASRNRLAHLPLAWVIRISTSAVLCRRGPLRAEFSPAKGLEDVGRTSVKDSDIPRQSGHTGQRQMEKSCTGGARTSPTRCRKPKPVTKPSASQVAYYVVTSAFGGAQRPCHRRWESLGEAGREGALGSMHRLRPQLCPLRGAGQQHGTESRSDTPWESTRPPRSSGSGSYAHNA